jgi:predicted transcriptional regulator
MRHEWIFDVLSDLKTYATNNDLPALAVKVEEAITIARAETDAQGEDGNGSVGHGGRRPPGRAH